jgi:hypothetical protein
MVTRVKRPDDEVDDRGRGDRVVWAGLVGALALVAGCSLYLALIAPPYLQDESSHVGYALSLRQGVLPSLDTPVPTAGGGPELEAALDRPWPFSVPFIHVANNPPFPYAAGLPLAEITHRAGMPGGGLFGIRLLNVAGGVAAVLCTYLLGRELSGGDRFVGLGAAGLLSGTIAIAILSSTANVDGPALAATTGTTWALARLARTRSLGDAAHLGIWCAAASAIRPMALAYALAAGALGGVLALRALGPRALAPLAVRLAVPTVLVSGWFYALSYHRYGDPAGSRALTAGREGTGWLDLVTGPEPFVQPLSYLVMEVYGRNPWWLSTGPREYAITVLALVLMATAVLLAMWSARRCREQGRPLRLVPAAWGAVAILGVVPMILIIQHMFAGGAGHARYLLPVLPGLAVATALVASRATRWLTVLLVGGFVLAKLTRLRAAGDLSLPAPGEIGRGIGPSVGGQPFLALAAVLAVVGAIAMLAALTSMAARGARRTTSSLAGSDQPQDQRSPSTTGSPAR